MSRMMDRAREIADSFENGEPVYDSPWKLEPQPDETDEDLYWRTLYQIAQKAAPELVKLIFQSREINPALRAGLLMQLWDKVHDKLYEKEAAPVSLKLELPERSETSAQWRERLSKPEPSLLTSVPTPDPKQS